MTLKTFKAEVHYQDQRYLGNFSAAASGPAGDFTLASPVSGDLVQLNLPSLQLRAGQGQAEGRVTLRFDNGVAGYRPAAQRTEPGLLGRRAAGFTGRSLA